jgi:hypothetical protein
MTCTGTGTCDLMGCTSNCTMTCDVIGNCEMDCTDPTCVIE